MTDESLTDDEALQALKGLLNTFVTLKEKQEEKKNERTSKRARSVAAGGGDSQHSHVVESIDVVMTETTPLTRNDLNCTIDSNKTKKKSSFSMFGLF